MSSKTFNYKKNYKYYKLNKPYGVLSQFTPDHEGQSCLKDLINVAKDVYPIGRLDKDSEGLILLSNDPSFNQFILHPKNKKEKEYWCQVEGRINNEAILSLKNGVNIRVNKKRYLVKAQAYIIDQSNINIPERIPPIRKRQNIPTSWVSITISEGKNRQVRRMLAAVNFPVLRLIRVRIDDIHLDNIPSGRISEINFA